MRERERIGGFAPGGAAATPGSREGVSRDERGSLLLAILPLALLAGGFVLLSVTSGRAQIQEQEALRQQLRALREADSALARAEARIESSGYTNDKNDVIQEALALHSSTGEKNGEGADVRVLAVFDRSEVWVSALSDGWYQLDAIGSVGRHRAHVRGLVRERDPFSRYGAFVNSMPLGEAGTPKGAIHTNKTLQLFFPGGYYADPVTAHQGFQYVVGATTSNTTFAGGANQANAVVPMPTVSTIANLKNYSDNALNTLLSGLDPNDYNVSVTLEGKTYDLVATPKTTGTTHQALGLPIPKSGVIFVGTDIASLQGTLDDRVTVASTGKVTITNSLRYVDASGEPIYSNGLSSDPANQPFVPNPAYSGNAALGVIANGDILYGRNVPDSLEVDGTFFSATGRYGLPGLSFSTNGMYVTSYDSTFQKLSYRLLGGIATDKRIVDTVVNGSGKVLSGFQNGDNVYDPRLRSNPPPHFLEIDHPVFSAYRILSGAPGGVESDESAAFSALARPIGAFERTKAGVPTTP